ncbi:protein FAR-RED ELONGATED HYPOCOTYL 3-like [Ziziphus jujuba]|uniref:Protein FAR-RED ELONGATED HYPOCOTYL 3-like n=1 Tax=Ziziphus jujuba TaxID=326968 RepID=A0A6P4A651_ZIZJJ|nr:protein FAR-RED ELONGATED HYPOCOTYL 3-like [Ziziphus jujuba]
MVRSKNMGNCSAIGLQGISRTAQIAFCHTWQLNDLQYEANNHHAGDVEISLLSCSNDVDDVYIPQVSENLKPMVGQEFLSIDEALEFYIKYSKEAGFSVRSNSSKRRKGTNEVIRKEVVCYKEGESSKRGGEKKRCRGITRDNFKAKLVVVMSKMGKYVISFLATNVPTHQQISILDFEAESIENIGCMKKDIYNYEAKLRNEMRGQDAELLKEYLLIEQERDPSFMFDDEYKLKRCFWSDLVCRRAYGCFGDVVVFDTTYDTNCIFYKEFQYCIWESECPEEFERKWASIIKKANLHDIEWLKSIFELRSRWVPVYVNHVFSPGMSSSQRAENSHAFVKRYFSKKNLLMDFILRFNKAPAHQSHEDLGADHVDINKKPVLKLPLEMEKQMAEIYTCKIFYRFQDELWHSLVTTPQIVSENDTHKMYTIQNCPNGGVPRFREITYDKVLDYASCSCKKFKSEGIPCRHILAILLLFGNIPLPNQYIMKKWTRVAKSQIIYDKEDLEITGKGGSMLTWRSKLQKLFLELVDNIMSNEEAAVIVNDALQSLVDKFKSVAGSTKSGGIFEKGSNVNDTILKDPSQVRAKGCERRLKGGKEKATNAAKYRGRRCNGRGKIDQAHNKRNCPVLNNR